MPTLTFPSREKGSEEFGTRTETKNLNSFKAIQRCIENEIGRQIDIIEEGGKVMQETRRWDDDKEYSYPMRSKEDAQDYRYFPDPDLVPIHVSEEMINEIKAEEPEFRPAKKIRYQEELGLQSMMQIRSHLKSIDRTFGRCCCTWG